MTTGNSKLAKSWDSSRVCEHQYNYTETQGIFIYEKQLPKQKTPLQTFFQISLTSYLVGILEIYLKIIWLPIYLLLLAVNK